MERLRHRHRSEAVQHFARQSRDMRSVAAPFLGVEEPGGWSVPGGAAIVAVSSLQRYSLELGAGGAVAARGFARVPVDHAVLQQT